MQKSPRKEVEYDNINNRHNLIIGNIYCIQDIFFPNEDNWLNDEYNNKIGLFLEYVDGLNGQDILRGYKFYIKNKIVEVDAWSINIYPVD